MAAELLDWLLRATLALSLAIVAVLLLRPLWRRGFGAGNGLWLWLLLPAALVAMSLPRPTQVVELATMPAPQARSPSAGTTTDAAVAVAGSGARSATLASNAGATPKLRRHDGTATAPRALVEGPVPGRSSMLRERADRLAPWLVPAWLSGLLLLGGLLIRQQLAFRRRLGLLQARGDGSWRASTDRIGPAVIGLLHPRIVVPADFEQRYDAEQRALVLAHERCHLRRGDLQVNLLLSAMRCVFWFNPLVHLASSRLRLDQELACDAAVLRRHPSAGRAYATALLNTQLADLGLPVGCYWQSSHPLKWRIAMMKQPMPGPARLLLAAGFALVASSATAATLWQARPARTIALPAASVPARIAATAPPIERVAFVPARPLLALSAPRTPEPFATTTATTPRTPTTPATPRTPTTPVTPVTTRTPEALAPLPELAALPELEAFPEPAPAPSPMPSVNAAPAVDAVPAVDTVPAAEAVPAVEAAPDLAVLKPPRVSRIWLADAPARGRDRQREREQGAQVVVQVEIGADGKPGEASVVHNELGRTYEQSALRAVRRWQFEPATRDGEAVASTVLVPVAFDLREQDSNDFWNTSSRPPLPGIPDMPRPAALLHQGPPPKG